MSLFPERRLFGDNAGAILAVASALYFSYLPVTYVTSTIGIAKWLGFIAILVLSLFVTFMRLARMNFLVSRYLVTAFLLYVPFLLYAGNSYAWSINYLNDYQTLVVITLINPIMIFLALMYGDNKEVILKAMLVLAALYFIFVARAALFGNLLSTNDFTQVFSFISSAEYQNINIYLGFLVILLWVFRIFKNPVWLVFKLALSLIILLLMFAVGGRASIVSAVVVLVLMLLLSRLAISQKLAIMLVLAGIVLLLVLYLNELLPGVNLLGIRRFAVLLGGDDSSERGFLFTHAWSLFMLSVKNIIFGAGMNYFPIYIGKTTTGWYPHNLILELLSEYGVIGFVLFSMPVVYLLHMRRKVLGSVVGATAVEKGSFFIFLYLLLESMVTGGLFYSWMLVFFIFFAFPGLQQRDYALRSPLPRNPTEGLGSNIRMVRAS